MGLAAAKQARHWHPRSSGIVKNTSLSPLRARIAAHAFRDDAGGWLNDRTDPAWNLLGRGESRAGQMLKLWDVPEWTQPREARR